MLHVIHSIHINIPIAAISVLVFFYSYGPDFCILYKLWSIIDLAQVDLGKVDIFLLKNILTILCQIFSFSASSFVYDHAWVLQFLQVLVPVSVSTTLSFAFHIPSITSIVLTECPSYLRFSFLFAHNSQSFSTMSALITAH